MQDLRRDATFSFYLTATNNFRNKNESQLNEYVVISTSVIHAIDKSLMVEYQMWNEDKTQLKSLLWSRFMHIDLITKRTTPHPKDIQEMLDSLIVPITEMTMDDRTKSLLSK